jgi:photosystem II Psb27 protein
MEPNDICMKRKIANFFTGLLPRLISLLLVASIALVGCGTDPGGLTGNYPEDTLAVVKSLRYTVQLPMDAPDRMAAQADARSKINSFAARYHLNTESTTLYSYTTLRTALNALASYYNGTTRRSVPEKVRDRVLVELDRVEAALAQGR